jgi:hypothetical protein
VFCGLVVGLGGGGGGGGGAQWGEMTQTMYAHANKLIIIIKNPKNKIRKGKNKI